MTLFILQSFDGLILDKELLWVRSPGVESVYATQYHDEAINQLIELNAADTALRAKVIKVSADSRGYPVIASTGSAAANNSKAVDAA